MIPRVTSAVLFGKPLTVYCYRQMTPINKSLRCNVVVVVFMVLVRYKKMRAASKGHSDIHSFVFFIGRILKSCFSFKKFPAWCV